MTAGNEIQLKPVGEVIERVIAAGDLSKLTPDDRTRYYVAVCESVGLNPLTQPFEYIVLNGKLSLYAKKACTDQLRNIRGVGITITSRERVDDLYVVTARAKFISDGKEDEDIGAVNVKGIFGEALANAMMKATTKAKRRVTLSICGLGMLDETEIEAIPPQARQEYVEPQQQQVATRTRKAKAMELTEQTANPTPAAASDSTAADVVGESKKQSSQNTPSTSINPPAVPVIEADLRDDDLFLERWIDGCRDRGAGEKIALEFIRGSEETAAKKGKDFSTIAWREDKLKHLADGRYDDYLIPAKPKTESVPQQPVADAQKNTAAAAPAVPHVPADDRAAQTTVATNPTPAPAAPTAAVGAKSADAANAAKSGPFDPSFPLKEIPVTAEAVAKWPDFVAIAVLSAVVRGITDAQARHGIEVKVKSLGKLGKEDSITVQSRLTLINAIRASAFDFSSGHIDRTKMALAS